MGTIIRSVLFAALTLIRVKVSADDTRDSKLTGEAAGPSYSEWLGQQLSWHPDKLVRAAEGAAHELEAAKTRLAWGKTMGFLADLLVDENKKNIDKLNIANGMMSRTGCAQIEDHAYDTCSSYYHRQTRNIKPNCG